MMFMKLIVVFAGVLAVLLFAGCSKSESKIPSSSASGTSTRPQLDPQQVPANLRDLLPLAAKWGIGDDVDRADMQAKATAQDKLELHQALKGRAMAVNDWLDSFGKGKMPAEAAAFMYMILGVDEMRLTIE
jgi:hypothetical protein